MYEEGSTYCSTCGARSVPGRRSCTECGTRVARQAPATLTRSDPGYGAGAGYAPGAGGLTLPQCPRCGYQGEGVSYFSRGSHIAALIGLLVFTAGIAGAGAAIYFFMRRDHQVCPRCGRSWGKNAELTTFGAERRPGSGRSNGVGTGGRGNRLQIFSVILAMLGFFMIAIGIGEAEIVPLLMGGGMGVGAFLMHRSAREAREARRAALISSLQLPVLKLAADSGGLLTVTQVAAQLGWTLPRAEKVLQSLDDGLRVDSEVTDEGIIVYEFRELRYGPDALPPGDGESNP